MVSSQEYWESIFEGIDPEDYDFSEREPVSRLRDFCDTYLTPEDEVLDLGCGLGRNAHYLGENRYEVYGIDFSRRAIELCRKAFEKFSLSGNFTLGRFERLPFPEGYFSGVVCSHVFDHITSKKAEETIEEVRRVLSPTGAIFLTFDAYKEKNEFSDKVEVISDGTLRVVEGGREGLLFHRYEEGEIRSLVGDENIVSFDRTEEGTRILICR